MVIGLFMFVWKHCELYTQAMVWLIGYIALLSLSKSVFDLSFSKKLLRLGASEKVWCTLYRSIRFLPGELSRKATTPRRWHCSRPLLKTGLTMCAQYPNLPTLGRIVDVCSQLPLTT